MTGYPNFSRRGFLDEDHVDDVEYQNDAEDFDGPDFLGDPDELDEDDPFGEEVDRGFADLDDEEDEDLPDEVNRGSTEPDDEAEADSADEKPDEGSAETEDPAEASSRSSAAVEIAVQGADTSDDEYACEAGEYIRKRLPKGDKSIFEIGAKLLEAKGRLKHRKYGPWVEKVFDNSPRSAQMYKRVAERLGSKSEILSHLPLTTLYPVSGLKPEAIETFIAAAEESYLAGHPMPVSDANKLIATLKKEAGLASSEANSQKLEEAATFFAAIILENPSTASNAVDAIDGLKGSFFTVLREKIQLVQHP